MRVKVREVKPPAEARGLEELVPEERPVDGRTVAQLVEHRRRPPGTNVGPNGDGVLEILANAGGHLHGHNG